MEITNWLGEFMKKLFAILIILIILFSFSLTGCHTVQNEPLDNNPIDNEAVQLTYRDTDVEPCDDQIDDHMTFPISEDGHMINYSSYYDELELMTTFQQLLEHTSSPFEYFNFLIVYGEYLSPENFDACILACEEKQISQLETFDGMIDNEFIQDAIMSVYDTNGHILNLSAIESPSAFSVIDEILQNGYKICCNDQRFIVKIDYRTYGIFEDYMSQEVVDYFSIRLNDAYVQSALIQRSDDYINVLNSNINAINNYIKNYPSALKEDMVLSMKHDYLQIIKEVGNL